MHVITPAVLQKIEDHGLTIEEVETVLAAPEQRIAGHSGRVILQSRIARFLIRIVTAPDREPPEVIRRTARVISRSTGS